MDRAFATMHEHYDKQVKLSNRVKSALAYPVFVFIVAIVVVAVLMVKVVPTFMAIFESYEAELPLPTKMLIAMSNFFKDNILILIAIAAIITLVYKLYSNTETGRMKIAILSRKLPVFGNIIDLTCASQFANTMATMLGSGLPVTRALGITAKTIDNYFVSTEVGKLTAKLEEGHALCPSIREAGILPDILVDMVGVGEETGELEGTLHTIAGYYDSELEVAIEAAMAKLEPAILVFLAGFAGFIVIAIYMAMFGMYAAM
jgi:type IV pilus assembly protein PilC